MRKLALKRPCKQPLAGPFSKRNRGKRFCLSKLRQYSERGVIVSNVTVVKKEPPAKERPPRKKMTGKRLKNLILNVLKNPFNMVVLVSLVVLFCLIVIPLLTMIKSTFTLAQGELRRVAGKVGDFTL